MTRGDLEKMWAWANDKLASGEQPAWAWDQYVKLCEVLDAIENGLALARQNASPPPQKKAAQLRLVADNGPARSAPRV